jgi:hypothetical protein
MMIVLTRWRKPMAHVAAASDLPREEQELLRAGPTADLKRPEEEGSTLELAR